MKLNLAIGLKKSLEKNPSTVKEEQKREFLVYPLQLPASLVGAMKKSLLSIFRSDMLS